MIQDLMSKIVSLCKRRGFVYKGSEIYGGLANTWDYGPLGVELMRNLQDAWWDFFVHKRADILGMDTNIFMNPKVWEASGHTQSFTDALIDCKNCQHRTRADHLIQNYFQSQGKEYQVEGLKLAELDEIIRTNKIPCPNCSQFTWTQARKFNLLFESSIGILTGSKSQVFLRGELAQGMFVNFKNILDSFGALKLPFGLAQIGKAFRNEVTLGNFIFRNLQFNLAEFEYFFNPNKDDWSKLYDYWKREMWFFATKILEINQKHLRWRTHSDQERSHYSQKTEDIDYKFPFGWKELYGLAYRTDYDLSSHIENSGIDLTYLESSTGDRCIPHVVEPTFGMDRSLMVVLLDKYKEEKDRTVLKLPLNLAPYKIAVFPLLKNKPELVRQAQAILHQLRKLWHVSWDERGNIGKRYYAQDEIGTPFCVTVDFDTLDDQTVTVRDRDTMKQDRVVISKLPEYFNKKFNSHE